MAIVIIVILFVFLYLFRHSIATIARHTSGSLDENLDRSLTVLNYEVLKRCTSHRINWQKDAEKLMKSAGIKVDPNDKRNMADIMRDYLDNK